MSEVASSSRSEITLAWMARRIRVQVPQSPRRYQFTHDLAHVFLAPSCQNHDVLHGQWCDCAHRYQGRGPPVGPQTHLFADRSRRLP